MAFTATARPTAEPVRPDDLWIPGLWLVHHANHVPTVVRDARARPLLLATRPRARRFTPPQAPAGRSADRRRPAWADRKPAPAARSRSRPERAALSHRACSCP